MKVCAYHVFTFISLLLKGLGFGTCYVGVRHWHAATNVQVTRTPVLCFGCCCYRLQFCLCSYHHIAVVCDTMRLLGTLLFILAGLVKSCRPSLLHGVFNEDCCKRKTLSAHFRGCLNVVHISLPLCRLSVKEEGRRTYTY